MCQDLPHFLKRIGFPEAHGAVLTAGREELAIGCEVNAANPLAIVTCDGLDFLSRYQVAPADRAVLTHRIGAPAIGRERDAREASRRPLEAGLRLARGQVPDQDLAV